jgi:hypothetical protein
MEPSLISLLAATLGSSVPHTRRESGIKHGNEHNQSKYSPKGMSPAKKLSKICR